MTAPNYTWYVPVQVEVQEDADSGLARQVVGMVPVKSSGEVLPPVWYASPELPYSNRSGNNLQLLVPGLPPQYSLGPAFVGPDGTMYGMVPEAPRGEDWRSNTAVPVRVWASPPSSKYAEASAAVVISHSVAPVPNPMGDNANTYWSLRLAWQDGLVCVADYRYNWYSEDVGSWRYAAGTAVIREGGAVEFKHVDDSRPDSDGAYYTSLLTATVKFADGRAAGAAAGEYIPI